MALELILVNKELSSLCSGQFKVDDTRGITIGRDEACDLVLQDESRSISGHHASIYSQKGHFYLSDTSTNGTFLNSSSTRIKRGTAVVLNSGDIFIIGNFKFSVESLASYSQPNPNTNNDSGAGKETTINVPKPPFLPEQNGDIPSRYNDVDALFDSELSSHQSDLSGVPDDLFNVHTPSSKGDPQKSDMNSLFDDWLEAEDDSLIIEKNNDAQSHHSPHSQPQDNQEHLVPDNTTDRGGASSATPSIDNWRTFLVQLEGGGDIDHEDPQVARNLGILVKALLGGVIELVRMREKIKNEYRLERTTIQSSNNNPFKFCMNTEDLLKAVTSSNQNTYVIGEQAVAEVIKDIVLHEMVVMSAMQGTLEDIINELNPANIEVSSKNQMNTIFNKINIKAKYWQEYQRIYAGLAGVDNDELVQKVNLRFIKNYEAEINKIKR